MSWFLKNHRNALEDFKKNVFEMYGDIIEIDENNNVEFITEEKKEPTLF